MAKDGNQPKKGVDFDLWLFVCSLLFLITSKYMIFCRVWRLVQHTKNYTHVHGVLSYGVPTS